MKSPPALAWPRRILKIVLVAELVYLLVVNALLQIPLTQDVINHIRPDKFTLRWEHAWTLLPFRFHVRNASANGDAPTQSWQLDVAAGSGSINPLALALKRVSLYGVRSRDVTYRQRPRYQPDRDYRRTEPYFPDIEGREPSAAVAAPVKKRWPWRVTLGDAEIEGRMDYWIYQFKGAAEGRVAGGLQYRTRGGPLILDVSHVDLELGQLLINGEHEVFPGGTVNGSIHIDSFQPREDRGLALLGLLDLDLKVDIGVNSLRFVNLFLLDVEGLEVDGSGRVEGRLLYDRGFLGAGSDLGIEASDLRVRFGNHVIDGQGTIDLAAEDSPETQLDLRIRYNDLVMRRGQSPTPLMTGTGLVLSIGGDNRLLPVPSQLNESRVVGLFVENLHVPDIARLQHYLPAGSVFRFTGGQSLFAADFDLWAHDAHGWLRLESRGVRGVIDRQEIQADLLVDVRLAGGDPAARSLDVTGTRLHLDEVRVIGDEQAFHGEAWAAELTMTRATAVIGGSAELDVDAELFATDSRPLVVLFMNQEGWRPALAARALTTEDIRGTGNMHLSQDQVRFSDLWVTSESIMAGMKGTITQEGMDAAVYLEAGKLRALLEIERENRKLRLIQPKEKYEAYTIEP